MRARLIAATLSCLVDLGYARTTAVEVCRRADVTRGALFHHFDSLPQLIGAALEAEFDKVLTPMTDGIIDIGLKEWLERFWNRINTPNFKAVLEVWLAARNDPEAMAELQEVIQRIGQLFDPLNNAALKKRLQREKEARAFFHTATEAMFGLMLGRVTTPRNAPLPHEKQVISYLMQQADAYADA